MKKRSVIALVAAVSVALLAGLVFVAGTKDMGEVRAYEMPAIDLAKTPDGAYSGEFTVTRWAIGVQVTVKDHAIEKIEVTDRKGSNITAALLAQLEKQLVGTNSPRFDIISGASYTTKGYLIAVAEALKNAR